MTTYNPVNILEAMEERIVAHDYNVLTEPFPCDRWLAASVMQKAVRRGHTETALRAAVTLWEADKQSFWRRAHTISVEDVGIGSPEAVVNVLTAHEAPAWRRRMGDLRVGLHLVALMCSVVKCRAADQMYTMCDRGPECQGLRRELAYAEDEDLAAYVADDSASLLRRLLSLWVLTGTRRFRSDYLPLRVGSPDKAVAALRNLDAPPGLIGSCIAVMNRTQWPLALMTPLICHAIKQQAAGSEEPIADTPHVDGIPVYGADTYTRIGKSCIRQFQRGFSILKGYGPSQIGVTLFYIEGEKTGLTLGSPVLDEYRRAGELADIEATGLIAPEYFGLKDFMIEHLPVLHDIRQRELRRYVDGGAE